MPEEIAAPDDAVTRWLNGVTRPEDLDSVKQFNGLNPDISRISSRAESKESKSATFSDKNAQPGVPLDTKEGAPPTQVMWSSFRKDPDQVIKYWQDLYGKENVRLSTSGVPIVRALNQNTGKPQDILVKPESMTWSDLTMIAGQLPEIAGAIIADKGVGMIPKLAEASGIFKMLRTAGAGAIGAEAGGTLKDVAARTIDQQPIPLDVFLERAKAIPTDIAGGLILGAGAKAISKVISPMSGAALPDIQQDAAKGAEALKARYNVNYPFTLGEKTGSRFFQRSEEEMRRLPGGSSRLFGIADVQESSMRSVMNVLQGLPADADEIARASAPTVETVGKRAIGYLRQVADEPQQRVLNAKQALIDEAHKNILSDMEQATIPTRQLYPETVGQAIRDKVAAKLADFQKTSSDYYNYAMSLPGGKDRILSSASLGSKAKAVLMDMPGKDTITTVPTGVLGPNGQPIVRTVAGKEILKEFVPPGVVGKLNELSTLGNTKFSLQDLISMRNEVTNDIKAGEAVPGVQTHYLGNIRDMLTDTIKDSTGAIPDQKLRNAWDVANNYYRDNVGQFHTKGVASILKADDVPGAVGNAAIVGRITASSDTGTDYFRQMKDFLGANSPQFALLKRSVADGIYENAKLTGTDTLDAKKFLSAMENLRTNQRSVFDDVFGARGNSMLQQGKNLGLAQSDKLSAQEMEAALTNPSSSPRLINLITEQNAKDDLFRNSILKAVGSKTLPANGIDAGDFVDRFSKSANPSEVKQAMDLIRNQDPATADAIKFKTIEGVLNDAERNPTATDRAAQLLRLPSSMKLSELIRTRGDTLKNIIGQDSLDTLKWMAQTMRPAESKSAAFASAGGLSSGMAVRQFWTGGVLGFFDKAIRNKVTAAIEAFPAVRDYASNQVMTPERTAELIRAAVMSRPVIQETIKEYGVKGAHQFASQVNAGLNNYVQQNQTPGTNQSKAVLDFLNQRRP